MKPGTFFFFFSRESESFMDLSTRHPDLELRYVHRMKYSDWQDGALFQAFRVGPLTIAPAWDEPPRIESGSVIRIDPGLAFGFGGHPTTRACLGILVKIYERYKPRTVLDLGTGTGILALAAATMGAEKICAVEYSHLAADTARENVSLNRLDGLVEVIRGQAEDYARRPAEFDAVQSALSGPGGIAAARRIPGSALADPLRSFSPGSRKNGRKSGRPGIEDPGSY